MRSPLGLTVLAILAAISAPFLVVMPRYIVIRDEVLSVQPIADPLPLYARAVLAAEAPQMLERSGPRVLLETYGPIFSSDPKPQTKGASISYQLTGTLDPNYPTRTVVAKLALYLMVEATLPRRHLFSKYLESVYLGATANGPIHGIAEASKLLLSKPKEQMTLSEAALLAGLIKSPAAFSPSRHPDHAKVRRDWVLKRMLDTGQIENAEFKRAVNEPLPGNA